jgi:aryl-alcohol dehydrogenase-like predicted oxidoreductase
MDGHRRFGTTDMFVSRVGLGTSALGGGDWALGWGEQDDATSVATIHHAIERGVNWLDTAAMYGYGRSEQVVGSALRAYTDADRPYVFTKCGIGWDPDDRSAPPFSDCSPDAIRRSLEGSLRRLGLERVDLLQVHWPSADGTALDDYWGALVDLRAEGKIRAAGLSNHGPTRVRRAEEIGHVDSLQPPFSAIKRSAAAELVPICRSNGTAVIAYSPMEGGLLSGAFSRARAASLADDDQRRHLPEYTTRLDESLAVADALRRVAERRGVQTAAVALAWTLAFEGVTGAIAGARTPEQADGWLAALDLELSAGELDEIGAEIERVGAGDGPARPPAVGA